MSVHNGVSYEGVCINGVSPTIKPLASYPFTATISMNVSWRPPGRTQYASPVCPKDRTFPESACRDILPPCYALSSRRQLSGGSRGVYWLYRSRGGWVNGRQRFVITYCNIHCRVPSQKTLTDTQKPLQKSRIRETPTIFSSSICCGRRRRVGPCRPKKKFAS